MTRGERTNSVEQRGGNSRRTHKLVTHRTVDCCHYVLNGPSARHEARHTRFGATDDVLLDLSDRDGYDLQCGENPVERPAPVKAVARADIKQQEIGTAFRDDSW